MSASCSSMANFFSSNFMLHNHNHNHNHNDNDHDHHPSSLSSLLPSCNPLDFHVGPTGMTPMLGKRSMSFSGFDMCEDTNVNNNNNVVGEDELSEDDGSQLGEKKRRLNMEQVKTLEKNFELGNKLEPERKLELAKALGLQPRQIAIWFQNRRARWKTKQLEKDYDLLKTQFDAIKSHNDALASQNHKLQLEIMALKCREPTESINLNKETEGSSSNRSENSLEIKLDIISRTQDDGPLDTSTHTTTTTASVATNTSRALFPSTTMRSNGPHEAQLLFHSPPPPQQQSVKEESFTNMFCGIDDQPGFWPWIEQHNFN